MNHDCGTVTLHNCYRVNYVCFKKDGTGEMKVSTTTVAALFSRMALTGQRLAMVDMVLLVFPAFPYYRRVAWSQSFPLKVFFSCCLGGGRYFSVPCGMCFGAR